ncbi:hypothetical protein [Vampirovibrio sp.]|uniref:hypothetical protein n=1 Tax=Vampirovibrio sp. TaxID=2717857 RepID=UPI003593203C
MNPLPAYPAMALKPYAPTMPSPWPADPASLVAQLGMTTQVGVDGLTQFNEALVNRIVALRENALPSLHLLLKSTNTTTTILEALHTASRLAEQGVSGVETLYPAAAHLNSHIDPAVQMQLARFYGKINEPKAIGPMLNTVIHYATNQYPMGSYAAYRFTEEAGEALINQVARRTAQETLRQLLPFLPPAIHDNPAPFNPSRTSFQRTV